MNDLAVVALAGFAAAFVDGSLGMGFGPTSSTLLLGAGLSPTAVSATVNLAKVATGMAGGVAHWRVGNVDRALVGALLVPGCVGALIGVALLTHVHVDQLRPLLAILLLGLSVRILVRAGRGGPSTEAAVASSPGRDGVIRAAGLAGGVVNGLVGSWGPVVTPVVMDRPGVAPRIAVGSVNIAEIAVAAAASGALIASVGLGRIDLPVLGALLAGGLVAAPIAALTARRVPARALAVGVGVLLAATNVRELAGWLDVGVGRWLVYGLILAAGVVAALTPRLRALRPT